MSPVESVVTRASRVVNETFVLIATCKLIFVPADAILSGKLYGGDAFVCGAVMVSAVVFCEYFFRETDECP